MTDPTPIYTQLLAEQELTDPLASEEESQELEPQPTAS